MTEESGDADDLVVGSDEDGLVTMTVTADRAYVVDVALHPDWRHAIVSTDLAPTVLRAFHSAQTAATARQQQILDATPPAPPPADAGPAPAPAPAYVQNLISTVLDQLDAYTARASRVRETSFEAASAKEAVTVTTRGGWVDGVTIDLEWARHAPSTDLAREIRTAFTAAQSRTADLAAEVGGPTSEMAELTGLVSDPARFLGLLGMRGGEAERP